MAAAEAMEPASTVQAWSPPRTDALQGSLAYRLTRVEDLVSQLAGAPINERLESLRQQIMSDVAERDVSCMNEIFAQMRKEETTQGAWHAPPSELELCAVQSDDLAPLREDMKKLGDRMDVLEVSISTSLDKLSRSAKAPSLIATEKAGGSCPELAPEHSASSSSMPALRSGQSPSQRTVCTQQQVEGLIAEALAISRAEWKFELQQEHAISADRIADLESTILEQAMAEARSEAYTMTCSQLCKEIEPLHKENDCLRTEMAQDSERLKLVEKKLHGVRMGQGTTADMQSEKILVQLKEMLEEMKTALHLEVQARVQEDQRVEYDCKKKLIELRETFNEDFCAMIRKAKGGTPGSENLTPMDCFPSELCRTVEDLFSNGSLKSLGAISRDIQQLRSTMSAEMDATTRTQSSASTIGVTGTRTSMPLPLQGTSMALPVQDEAAEKGPAENTGEDSQLVEHLSSAILKFFRSEFPGQVAKTLHKMQAEPLSEDFAKLQSVTHLSSRVRKPDKPQPEHAGVSDKQQEPGAQSDMATALPQGERPRSPVRVARPVVTPRLKSPPITPAITPGPPRSPTRQLNVRGSWPGPAAAAAALCQVSVSGVPRGGSFGSPASPAILSPVQATPRGGSFASPLRRA